MKFKAFFVVCKKKLIIDMRKITISGGARFVSKRKEVLDQLLSRGTGK